MFQLESSLGIVEFFGILANSCFIVVKIPKIFCKFENFNLIITWRTINSRLTNASLRINSFTQRFDFFSLGLLVVFLRKFGNVVQVFLWNISLPPLVHLGLWSVSMNLRFLFLGITFHNFGRFLRFLNLLFVLKLNWDTLRVLFG